MPFRSSAQRRFLFLKHPDIAKRWAQETPKGAKLPEHVQKKAAMDPKKLFENAFRGALGGAVAGSRRSIDDKTLHGIAQGAAMGAVGGVLAGEAVGGKTAPLVGGGLAGYIASRGPRGESRPLVHVRVDKNETSGDKTAAAARPVKTAPAGNRLARNLAGAVLASTPMSYLAGHDGYLVPHMGVGAGVHNPRPMTDSEFVDVDSASGRNAGSAAAKIASEMREMVRAQRNRNRAQKKRKNNALARVIRSRSGSAKHAGMADHLTHGAELAGLGILAAPSIAEMRGKKVSDKTKHRAEVAGLGVLAVPSAAHFAHEAYGKLKSKLVKIKGPNVRNILSKHGCNLLAGNVSKTSAVSDRWHSIIYHLRSAGAMGASGAALGAVGSEKGHRLRGAMAGAGAGIGGLAGLHAGKYLGPRSADLATGAVGALAGSAVGGHLGGKMKKKEAKK